MKLYIKNMVSRRCKEMVKAALLELGFEDAVVELGEANVSGQFEVAQYEQFSALLLPIGLELMEDKKNLISQRIEDIIHSLVYTSEEPSLIKLSIVISQQLQHEYVYLANVFSEIHEISIEQFFIIQKIERVKKLLVDNKATLTDISYLMSYSSVAHLSRQFKKVVGLTPSHFKNQNNQ